MALAMPWHALVPLTKLLFFMPYLAKLTNLLGHEPVNLLR